MGESDAQAIEIYFPRFFKEVKVGNLEQNKNLLREQDGKIVLLKDAHRSIEGTYNLARIRIDYEDD